MKTLDLKKFGVQEMDARETVNVDGGYIILGPMNLFKAIREGVGTVAGWTADALHGAIDGFKEGAK